MPLLAMPLYRTDSSTDVSAAVGCSGGLTTVLLARTVLVDRSRFICWIGALALAGGEVTTVGPEGNGLRRIRIGSPNELLPSFVGL
jgi:hypothetical protein